jgi:hypothetical protein
MTREICRALDIDIHSLLDMVQDPESSLRSESHTSSEMTSAYSADNNSYESTDVDAPHGLE